MVKIKIQGAVEDGYEKVREVFSKHFEEGREDNAQCVAYVDGKRVVDLWGSATGNDSYDGDSLQTVFSSTKVLAATAIACLVDRGLLDYNEKVVTYWPEFGQNGKGELRLEDVLRHEAGIAWLHQTLDEEDLLTANIKKNSIGKVIEEEPLVFPPKKLDSIREYHGVTRGWILNEIFRRVEPQGRTIGEFLRQEVCDPLGADAIIGATDADLKRYQPLSVLGFGEVLVGSLIPNVISSKVEIGLSGIFRGMMAAWRATKREGGVKPPPALKGMGTVPIYKVPSAFDIEPIRRGEIPSGNGGCSARGLARIAACLAGDGAIDGVRIMSAETHKKMHDCVVTRKDVGIFGMITDFSQGGICYFKKHPEDNAIATAFKNNRDGFVGWGGFGGSIVQWHPEQKISFAYVPSRSTWYDAAGLKGSALQKAVVEAVKAKKAK